MANSQTKLSTIRKSLRAGIRSLKKSVKSLFDPAPPLSSPTSSPLPAVDSAPFVVFGILGIVGPLEHPNAAFMMSDFVVWSAFFWQFPGLDKARSKFNSVKPVVDFFPGKKVVFGEAACERVQLPLPPCLDMTDYSTLNENEFVTRCIVELVRTAEAMQKNETLVILLIGHGGLSNKRFQFFITHGYGISGPAWITKRGLEDALERCVANIVVVCNSCHSGALKSPLWTLLCAAGPLERSDALTPSQSGYVRGSSFTLCALAQAGLEQGLSFPLPRSEPRPPGTKVKSMVLLPLSAPPHSFLFSSSGTLLDSSQNPLPRFLQGMLVIERFLVMESSIRFWQYKARDNFPWHRILPLIFTDSFLQQIEVYKLDPLARNAVPSEGGVSVETLVEDSEEGFPMDMVLSLAREFSRVSQSLFTYEGRMADRCIKFMGSNDRSTEVAKDLLYDLYNRHVQATVVQELARRLGWWTGETVPFFFVIQEAIHEDHQTTMVHAGIPVDEMLWNLLPFYPGIFGVIDRASHYWLASKWVEAGSPTMTLEEWDEAVVTAAKEGKQKTLVKDHYKEYGQFFPS